MLFIILTQFASGALYVSQGTGTDSAQCGKSTMPCKTIAYACAFGQFLELKTGNYSECVNVTMQSTIEISGESRDNCIISQIMFELASQSISLTVSNFTYKYMNNTSSLFFINSVMNKTNVTVRSCRIITERVLRKYFIHVYSYISNVVVDSLEVYNLEAYLIVHYLGDNTILKNLSFVNVNKTNVFYAAAVKNVTVAEIVVDGYLEETNYYYRFFSVENRVDNANFSFKHCTFKNCHNNLFETLGYFEHNYKINNITCTNCTSQFGIITNAYRYQMAIDYSRFIQCSGTYGGVVMENGGVVLITSDSTVSINRCIFANCTGLKGGAVFINSSQLTNTISECVFIGNKATGSNMLLGNDIYCEKPSGVTIKNVYTDQNLASLSCVNCKIDESVCLGCRYVYLSVVYIGSDDINLFGILIPIADNLLADTAALYFYEPLVCASLEDSQLTFAAKNKKNETDINKMLLFSTIITSITTVVLAITVFVLARGRRVQLNARSINKEASQQMMEENAHDSDDRLRKRQLVLKIQHQNEEGL